MSSGEFLVFGLPCPSSSSLPHLDSSLRYNNSFLTVREGNKLILPPAKTQTNERASIAVTKLCSQSLVLLEDGQLHDLDDFQYFEPAIRAGFEELNRLKLPVIDVAIGGSLARQGSTRLSTAAGGGAGQFVLALTSTGDVYSFGLNSSGQCGVGHTRTVTTPTRLAKFAPNMEPSSNIARASQQPLPMTCVAIAAGRAHSMILTSDGSLYTFGRGVEGQTGLATTGRLQTLQQLLHTTPHGPEREALEAELGVEESKLRRSIAIQQASTIVVSPKFVHHFAHTPIRSIAACNHLSAAIDASGRVWYWGYGLTAHQATVPTLLPFVGDTPPRIDSIALGHGHAVLLGEGQAYTIGSSLSGALGLGPLSDLPKCLTAAQLVQSLASESIVAVYAGNFYTAFLAASGQVFVAGSNEGGKLSKDTNESIIATPRLLDSISDKMVSQLYPGSTRLIVFVPTRLTGLEPSVLSLDGGTHLILRGDGFATRGAPGEIVVNFTYLGRTIVQPGEYDAVHDTIRAVAPVFANGSAMKGGVYKNDSLEDCIIRASLDGGRHWTNALSIHAFAKPNCVTASPDSLKVVPSHGPIQGGTALTLYAPFDLVPYETVLVRFIVDEPATGERHELSTVRGSFDPIHRAVKVITPNMPEAFIPPSSTIAQPLSPSRFRQVAQVPPKAASVRVFIAVSLDGQTFFGMPHTFEYTHVQCESIEPPALPLAGGSLRLRVSGVRDTSAIRVKFSVGSYGSQIVSGIFRPLGEARAIARQERQRAARIARKRRSDEAEATRQAALAQAAWEEEHRDPKEKERIAREKEKLEQARERELAKQREKDAAQAKKDALAAAAAAAAAAAQSQSQLDKDSSRPESASSSDKASPSPSRPRSSLANRSRAHTPIRPGSAVSFANDLVQPAFNPEGSSSSSSSSKDTTAENTNDNSSTVSPDADTEPPFTPLPPDEFDELEARIEADEAKENKAMSLLNAQDRAGIGYILCDTKSFTTFGPCRPVISISLNGGQDFEPVNAVLSILVPTPQRIEPNCGPITGGTHVRLVGEYFYHTPNIEVQLRPLALPPSTRPPTGSLVDAALPTPSRSRATSAGKKPSTSTTNGGGSHRMSAKELEAATAAAAAAAAVAAQFPPPPPQPINIQSSYEVMADSVGVAFQTPAWPCVGPTRAHVAFEPRENAFSTIGATFQYYDTPHLLEATPAIVSQSSETEVTLIGRGFVHSNNIRVRLTLHDEELTKGAHKPPPTASTASHDDHAGMSSARRRLAAASSHAALIDEANAAEQKRTQTVIELVGQYHPNDEPVEVDEKKKKSASGTSGTGSKRKDTDIEPDQATISFIAPKAIAFNPDFADGSASNRSIGIELALNGQQFVPTGLIVRFEKDMNAKKKVEIKKK